MLISTIIIEAYIGKREYTCFRFFEEKIRSQENNREQRFIPVHSMVKSSKNKGI